MKYIFAGIIILTSSFTYAQNNTLDNFIQRAQENSPLIKDYSNQVLAARLDSLLFRAVLKTQVNFISSNSYAPVIHGYGYDGAITNSANISSIVQANRNFLSANNIGNQITAIRLQTQALSDTIQISEQDIIRAVTDQYILAYGDQLAMDFNLEIYNLLQQEEQALKKLTQASVYKQADYLAFYTTLQQQQFTYLQSQIQYNADYLTLNYLAKNRLPLSFETASQETIISTG